MESYLQRTAGGKLWGKEKARICELDELGSLHWKHSELVFERKGLIPELRRLLAFFEVNASDDVNLNVIEIR